MINAENLTYAATENGYTIFLNGTPWIVQDGYIPYPGTTLGEIDMSKSAQNHINQILADQAAAEQAANQPTLEDRVKALEAAQLAALGV